MKNNKKGFGTIELIILIAISVGIALIFKTFIVEYSVNLMDNIKTVEINIGNLEGN